MFTLGAGKTLAASGPTAVNFFVFGDAVTTTDAFDILAKGSVSVAATVIYTATGVQALIKTLEFFNTAGTPSTIFLYGNGTATTDRFFTATIPAGGTLTYGNAGWQMTDSTGAIVVTASAMTLTGDVTASGLSPLATTISPNVVSNAKLAQGAANTMKGNFTNAPADEQDSALAANQFFARSSTGNIAAKTLTDVGFSWLALATIAAQTAALNPATTSLQGMLSPAGFKKLAGYYDMVADWGFVGDDATDNLAAWNTFKAAVPNNAICYFPPGTYRFSAEATLDQDKHLQFHGAGAQVSTLKIMAAAANLINITGAAANAWYNTFSDLGFASGVTKTAGAHIGINVATAIGIDIRRCAFTGHFIGIDAQGSQAGNVSVWDSNTFGAPAVNGRAQRINGSVINLVIQNSTANGVPNAGAIAGSANLEVNQSGAVQLVANDYIGAINSLLINANQGGGTSVAAIYCTNMFFDQSGGSTVKIAGANTTNRVKFMQCGIAAGVIGGHAFEVAGTGAGAVGSATAMPAGISLVDCDIYYAPGGGTGSGVHVNGCQDINIQNTRSAGFSGAGGCGVHVIPSASNQTRVRINGCRIGPNSNLTINNTAGVQLDVGASGIGALSITDNDIAGNGTAIVDNSTTAAGSSKFINNNLGAANGLSATLFAPAGSALSATEAIIAQIALPANSAKVGTTIAFEMTGTSVVTVTTTVRLHIGPLGTTADPSMILTAASAAAPAVTGGLVINGAAQVATVGATAGGSGGVVITTATTTGAPIITATGTFNSAVANFVTLGALCSAAGHTVKAATMTISGPA